MTRTPAQPEKIHYQTQPSPSTLERLGIAEELGRDFAYQADAVRSTLIGMTQIEGAELTVALVGDRIVGFLLLSEPHPQSRWGRAALEGLYEVMVLEVARRWRGQGIGTGLLGAALTSSWEERILLASLDPEEWDILGAGLSRRAYRRMLLSLFRSAGFAEYPLSLDAGLSHDPLSLFLVRVGARVGRKRLRRFEALLGRSGPASLIQINQLPREEREAIYRRLIPEVILTTLGIDARALTDSTGNRLVEFACPPEQDMVWVGVRGRPDESDWYYFIKLQSTAYNNIELAFVTIGDPGSERFHIDRDPEGRDTGLGTRGRNVSEEVRAMRAGLAPGQTRRGLLLLKEVVRLLEEFVDWMGHDLFLLDAMFYHNAILYERYGFGYTVGQEEMERIHREFQPGGALYARLDGSTPFRQPGAEQTVRGRSWAIQDGILGEPWRAPRMVKRVGHDQQVSTFPGGPW
ncbi:MAG: GNAT family N-acetyltransferase [Candidatus Methylomirabilales bacterium]